MGLTKQYLRYVASSAFGVVASQKSNILLLEIRGTRGKYCAVGACEDVIIWDLRTSEKHLVLHGDKNEVSIIAKAANKRHMAVGYTDGMVKVFDLNTGESTISFSGHKSEITALNFDSTGLRLVSGSKDTHLIVWDIVNESGLFRLKGHKGPITQAVFIKNRNMLLSSSKDTYLKFWDLETQHCFKTLVGHRSEVFDFVMVRNGCRLITGSGDSELRVWDIEYLLELDNESDTKLPQKESTGLVALDEDNDSDAEDDKEMELVRCEKMGSVMRNGKGRVVSLDVDPEEQILTCHGTTSLMEVFKLPNKEDLDKLLAKRRKKAKKKLRDAGQPDDEVDVCIQLKDELVHINQFKLPVKIISVDLVLDTVSTIKIACALDNNVIEHFMLDFEDNKTKSSPCDKHQVHLLGHRSAVRTLTFSSDNTAIVSGSGHDLKIWNRASLQCIRTMECDYALCSVFAPGDRHVIIGTKAGKLQIFDVASGSLLEDIAAHDGALWSISMVPDKRGIASGGADKCVKFWNFELITDETYSTTSKRLSLEQTRVLKMDEDVLCVKYSRDQRLLAVSLLDNTVKVFFADTLKFFLSLYGHKLPVLCLDISADSTLIVTGSADRNIKIWGLDFGDCHKSIFAHDDSIMCLQFVGNTHYFFSGGKDKKVKEWDGDNFELIQTLDGHLSQIWCLAVSPSGNFVASASNDRCIRLWEKTREPIILNEEREMEREKEFEETVQDGEPVVAGETTTEVAMAGKKTIETVKAAERLMEALELHKEETEKHKQYEEDCKRSGKELPTPATHPMFMAFNVTTPDQYMLDVLKKVKSSELEESLLVLPFNYVIDLLKVLDSFIEQKWEVELSCRCLFFLLRVHHGQITSNQVLMPIINKLRTNTLAKVSQMRDCIGFNTAGLKFLKRKLEENSEISFFVDATDRFDKKKKKMKKKAILTIKS